MYFEKNTRTPFQTSQYKTIMIKAGTKPNELN